MRETTERPEGVEAGCARLVGTNADTIIDSTCLLLDNEDEHRRMAGVDNPYGDGTAARQIVDAIASRIGARIAA
jgi:UDP-N-acetylglucosamine 2-epimerase (non-hydrolysing)